MGDEAICIERKLNSSEVALAPIGVACVVVVETNGFRLTSQQAVQACTALSDRHPVLRRKVVKDEGGHLHYVEQKLDYKQHSRVARLADQDDVVPLPENGQWLDVLQEELHRPGLTETSSLEDDACSSVLWRSVILIGKNVVVSIFSYSHAIGDGLSGHVAQNDLLALLDSTTGRSRTTGRSLQRFASTDDSNKPTPNLREELGQSWIKSTITGTMSFFAAHFPMLAKWIEPKWLFFPAQQYPDPKTTQLTVDLDMYTIVRRSSVESFTKLKAACKRQGTTIGGFFAAALFFFGAALAPSSNGHQAGMKSEQAGLSYDANMRGRTKKDVGPNIGVFITVGFIELQLDRSRMTFWDLARKSSNQMRDKLKGGANSQNAIFMELLYRIMDDNNPFRKRMQRKTSAPKAADLNYSNVGPWKFAEKGILNGGNIRDVFTAQSGGSEVGFMFFASCADNHLCLSTSSMRSVFPDAFASKLLDVVLQLVDHPSLISTLPESDLSFVDFFKAAVPDLKALPRPNSTRTLVENENENLNMARA